MALLMTESESEPAAPSVRIHEDEDPKHETDSLQEDHPQYPNRLSTLLLDISALVVIQFLQGLDGTIVTTAIPKITNRFHALGDVGWYASSFMLTFCSFQLIWGKLYTFYTVKWTYLVGLFLFELGSFICGIAPSSTSFIVGRAIAGLGGGGTGAGSLLLVTYLLPPPRRPALIGILTAIFGFGAAVGPLLGGAFTDNATLTWRWCFYINLPLGALAATIVVFCIPSNKPPGRNTAFRERLLQMDLLGAVLLVPGMISLLLALQWGGSKYPWSDGRVVATLVVAGVLETGFVLSQICRKDESRIMISPRLFKDPRIWSAVILGAAATASFFVMLYNLPIWFQAVKGASAASSGVMSLPMTISFLVASTLGGTLSSSDSSPSSSSPPPTRVRAIKRLSPTTTNALLMLATPILLSTGSGLLTTLTPHSSTGQWIGYQILLGSGGGLGMQLSMTAAQSLVSHADITMGTTIILLCQNLTATVLASVAATVLNSQLAVRLRDEVPGLHGDTQLVTRPGATGFRDVVPAELIPAILVAYNKALTRTFLVSVGVACLGIGAILWVPLGWRRAARAQRGADA
ncbi:MFS general substrate transporter [Aspergillus brunneoviolaceus CBS 621.78]|uniref:MFS general substrate transporter n=1 Tax=Aspergillus brunneoviolaceus CBS 621.78 TaxID=1450534 RepID=A0ACD1FTZ6_9EURO|nr:MFS general substrate transporter [Aspergillus brunneoviolaceus CBS 621.78]RAH40465.1 MFS general substrate transporter [Aspergillus brunneoviolaceus CBS 621.78]